MKLLWTCSTSLFIFLSTNLFYLNKLVWLTRAELGALALGKRAHVYILKIGLSVNLHVNNALLDLYANVWEHKIIAISDGN